MTARFANITSPKAAKVGKIIFTKEKPNINTDVEACMWNHLRAHSKDSELIAEIVKTHDDETNPPWLDYDSDKSGKTESEKIESASMIEMTNENGEPELENVENKSEKDLAE